MTSWSLFISCQPRSQGPLSSSIKEGRERTLATRLISCLTWRDHRYLFRGVCLQQESNCGIHYSAVLVTLQYLSKEGYKTVRCASNVLLGLQQEANLIQFLVCVQLDEATLIWFDQGESSLILFGSLSHHCTLTLTFSYADLFLIHFINYNSTYTRSTSSAPAYTAYF